MRHHRINDPEHIDSAEIAEHIGKGSRVIVQYSKSPYMPEQLELLNQLAKANGRNLEIRFYGHYSEVFDASVLRAIPDVKSLSIDCIWSASNLDTLSELRELVELNFGVFELDDANILRHCCSSSLEALTLGPTKSCGVDLAYLADCSKLKQFHTTGHKKNIATICRLASLRYLYLSSFKKRDDIGFLSDIPALEKLRFIIGGRRSISEITSSTLRELEIIRVQGLEDLGNLGRFENLTNLSIEDQIRLTEIKVDRNPNLQNIKVINCKSLDRISGISNLEALSKLRIYRTAIDYDDFVSSELPRTLKNFAFYSGKSRRDAEIGEDLKRRGFEGSLMGGGH